MVLVRDKEIHEQFMKIKKNLSILRNKFVSQGELLQLLINVYLMSEADRMLMEDILN